MAAVTRALLLVLTTLGLGLLAVQAGEPTTARRTALVLEIEGVIGPATASYLSRGLKRAQDRGASLVILRMDTPGGLDTSMRDIIRDILASTVPVATYVTPSGARAASAGTYILYASHIAAMTPGTNLGAATPVQLGGMPGTTEPAPAEKAKPDASKGDSDDKSAPQAEPTRAPKNASEAKAINDAIAYIRSLAELRDRNVEWAEKAVRDAASLSAGDALKQNVIDLVARDLGDLLKQADGRSTTVRGATLTLMTQDMALEYVAPDWRTELLGAITNPNIALILMMIGVYGLIFEFSNPGAVYPGTIGAICLIVGLYALAALPVNYAGIGLIVLGLALMTGEAFAPSFGALGIGGAIAFVLGAAILIDTDIPEFSIAWPVLAGTSIATVLFMLIVVRTAFSSRRRKIVSGREHLIGSVGSVEDWEGAAGHVFIQGERWNAVSVASLARGQRVRVVGLSGLTLQVAPEATI